jgi:Tol biopolymer transport system component
MRRLSLLLGPLATLLVYFLVTARPVYATFPGANGQIAFAQLRADGSGADVFIANPDGLNIQQVPLTFPAEAFGVPIWSPDGSKLLISHTIRVDSSGQCCLFQPAIVELEGFIFNQLVPPDPEPGVVRADGLDCGAWYKNGTRLLCSFGGTHAGIFSIRASDGGGAERLTTFPFGACNGCDGAQDFSPDGGRFVLLRFKRDSGASPPQPPPLPDHSFVTEQVAIFIENVDGTGLTQITPYGLAAPHEVASAKWSPDGRNIISEMKNGRLFVVHPDGTGLTPIQLQVGTQQYFAFEPHWSPDGTRIIFCMFVNAGEGIYTANPDGTDVKQVTFTTDFSTIFNGADWGTHPVQ